MNKLMTGKPAANSIIIISLMFLLIISSASAIEMKRIYSFAPGEEKIYDFLGKEYRVRVLNTIPGNEKAVLEINGFDKEVTSEVPAVFQDLKVTIKKIEPFSAELMLFWEKEDENPDKKVHAIHNLKETVDANGKKFAIVLKEIDEIRKKAIFEINGEEVKLGELEKATLRDGSLVKAGTFSGTNIRSMELSIWASDSPNYHYESQGFDAEIRLGKNQQTVVEAKGVRLNIAVNDITKDEVVVLNIEDEQIVLVENEQAMLNSNIEIKVSQISLKQPESVLVSIRIPEELVSEQTAIVVDRTIGMNQKDEFVSEGRTIVTRVMELDEETDTVKLFINNKNISVSLGEEKGFGDLKIVLKNMNPFAHPPKVIVSYLIPKKTRPKQKVAEPEEEPAEQGEAGDEENKDAEPETEKQEIKEMENELDEVEEDLSEQEIPEPELPEEEQMEPLNLGESIKWTYNKIISFFAELFR